MTLPDCMMPDGADPCRGYHELRAKVERLQKENHQLRVTLADKARTNMELWTTLQRIDGINDDPFHFNADIDAVLTTVLKPRP